MSDEEMITLSEAEERFHISRDSIYYQVRKGTLKTYKRVGDRKAYVKAGDIEELTHFRPTSVGGDPQLEYEELDEAEQREVELAFAQLDKDEREGKLVSPEQIRELAAQMLARYRQIQNERFSA